MAQKDKAREELIEEIELLKKRVAELEIRGSERKNAETDLRNEKAFRESALNAITDIFYAFDKSGKFLIWNEAFKKITGYSDAELHTMKPTDFFSGEDAQRIFAAVERIWKYGISGEKADFILKDGKRVPYEFTGSVLKDGAGNIVGFSGTGRDLSERKKAEEELKISERRYRTLFERSKDAIFIADPQTRMLVDCNGAALEMTGYLKEEVLSMRADQLHPSDVIVETMEVFGRQASGEDIIAESVVLTKAGKRVFVSISTVIVELSDKAYIMGVFRDVSFYKKAEETLTAARLRQKAILDNIPDIAWFKDEEGRFIMVNEPFGESCGVRAQDIIGKTDFDIWPRELAEKYRADDKDVMVTGRRKSADEPLMNKEGKASYIETIKSPVYDAVGAIIGTVGIARDITERKKAEEELKVREELYRSLFSNMLNGFAYCKMLYEEGRPRDFVYLAVNAMFETQTGLKDVVGKKVSEVIPGIQKMDQGLIEIYGRVAQTGVPEKFEIYVHALKMWFAVSAYRTSREHFAAVFDVITDRKKIEEEGRKHMKKMEVFYKASIGREERILELKKEIEALKKEMKK